MSEHPLQTPSPARAPVIAVAPDSFKGSLSAAQVADAVARGLRRALPDAVVRLRPMADGGEGTLDALLADGRGRRQRLPVRDALAQPRDTTIGLFDDASVLIETADIAGITDARGMRMPIEARASYGVGDAIRAALDLGAQTLYLALGGSSTNDAGAGLLVALGLRIADAAGQPLGPTPAELARAAHVDASGLDQRLAGVRLVAMADVDNPLCGDTGASAIFGPQKGARAAQIAELDAALGHFATLLERALGRSAQHRPGAGAAGGLGFALLMLGAEFRPGAEVVAERIGLDAALDGADWLITGEGRSDAQTLRGKAPLVACQRARRYGVPTSLLSGAVDPAGLAELGAHFAGCFSAAPGPITLDAAIGRAAELLADAAEQMARLRYAIGPRPADGATG